MAKNEDVVTVSGIVVDALPNAEFQVELDPEVFGPQYFVTASLSGKMRMYSVRITRGDKVDLKIMSTDTARGRIVYRHR